MIDIEKMVNPPGIWQQRPDGLWLYLAPGYAVYGTAAYVTLTSNPAWEYDGRAKTSYMWEWEARVMMACQIDNQNIRGRCHTEAEAKRAVEVLCEITRTAAPRTPENNPPYTTLADMFTFPDVKQQPNVAEQEAK